MARTAQHMSHVREQVGRAWRTIVLYDLRYSAACLAVQGRRPRPERVRRVVAIYSYPRAFTDNREVGRLARIAERQARRRLRHELRQLEVDDVVPVRHRHEAVYHAW